jgi:hypothetical protein
MQSIFDAVDRVTARHKPVTPCGVCKGNGHFQPKPVKCGRYIKCLACSGTGIQQWKYQAPVDPFAGHLPASF